MSTPTGSKKVDAGEVFLAGLSPAARAAITGLAAGPLEAAPAPRREDADDAEYDGERFAASLSPAARAWLAQAGGVVPPPPNPAAEAEAAAARGAKYLIIESGDSGWATVRACRGHEAMARRLQELEGTDTVVHCVYGVPLRVSRGPQRYVELPGGRQVVSVPLYDGGPVAVSPKDDAAFVPQADGFLGPPELSAPRPAAVPAGAGEDEEDDE